LAQVWPKFSNNIIRTSSRLLLGFVSINIMARTVMVMMALALAQLHAEASNTSSTVTDTVTDANATTTTTTTTTTKAPTTKAPTTKAPTTAAPTTAAPTTAAPTTAANGTTGNTTGGSSTSTFTGKFTVSLSGATKAQMETATKKTLAKHFAVAESKVTTTATKSRRLSEARNLADAWSIDYSFTVPTSQAAAVETKVAATKTSSAAMKSVLKTELVTAGVDQTNVDAMTVSSFTSTKTVSGTTSTTGVESTSPSARHFLSIGVMMITMNLLMRGR